VESFRKKLLRLLKDAIRLSLKKKELKPKDFERLKSRLYLRLDQFLNTKYKSDDGKRLIKRLKRHRNELFTFLEYEGVSPYNNHAEQQMRKPVFTRKISQQNRSDQGAKTQSVLMTLFRSAELQGKNPVETILSMAKHSISNDVIFEENLKMAA
jgi:transposase